MKDSFAQRTARGESVPCLVSDKAFSSWQLMYDLYIHAPTLDVSE